MKAKFIVIEGIDGCGKTSAVKAIGDTFPDIYLTREPGGTFLAEKIRNILLSEKGAILSTTRVLRSFKSTWTSLLS